MANDSLDLDDLIEGIVLPDRKSDIYIPKYKDGHLSILNNYSQEGFVANFSLLQAFVIGEGVSSRVGSRWVPIGAQKARDEFRTNKDFRRLVKKYGVYTSHVIIDYRFFEHFPETSFGVMPFPQIEMTDNGHLIGESIPIRKSCPTVVDCLVETGLLKKPNEEEFLDTSLPAFGPRFGGTSSSIMSIELRHDKDTDRLAFVAQDTNEKNKGQIVALMKIDDPKAKEAESVMYV